MNNNTDHASRFVPSHPVEVLTARCGKTRSAKQQPHQHSKQRKWLMGKRRGRGFEDHSDHMSYSAAGALRAMGTTSALKTLPCRMPPARILLLFSGCRADCFTSLLQFCAFDLKLQVFLHNVQRIEFRSTLSRISSFRPMSIPPAVTIPQNMVKSSVLPSEPVYDTGAAHESPVPAIEPVGWNRTGYNTQHQWRGKNERDQVLMLKYTANRRIPPITQFICAAYDLW